ncbi:hypothetical protein B0T11DRAFT_331327 [Plectosphaerella cucumerina]|uniref:Uncharacterized protein n=1 Tax=Plectosphaerella cucumerina TaxID=40658 RepID=A0A8K0TDD0_9PEZI|nr:hypothetical protein B0T11DRAFT_331327 [Plectosphaerella cucumerina]
MREHEVGDTIRDLAAEGIAMQGFQATSKLLDPALQFQIYPMESAFGIRVKGLPSAMAMKMARFAMGIVAVTAANNPQITINGAVPQQAVRLVVEHWEWATPILVTVVTLHLALALTASFVTIRVAVPTGGPIAFAQVLRPLANLIHLGDKKSLTERDSTGRWMYRYRL